MHVSAVAVEAGDKHELVKASAGVNERPDPRREVAGKVAGRVRRTGTALSCRAPRAASKMESGSLRFRASGTLSTPCGQTGQTEEISGARAIGAAGRGIAALAHALQGVSRGLSAYALRGTLQSGLVPEGCCSRRGSAP